MPSIRTLLVYFVMAVCIQALIIPPLQSPDETDHIKRAWFLAHGQVLLDPPGNPSESGSGGQVDTGLLEYIKIHSRIRWNPRLKLTVAEIDAASKIHWTGESVFSSAPGTGYYFPLIYLPQAIALKLGWTLDLSIHASYWLARIFTLASAVSALYAAFALSAPNVMVLSILVLPMCLFQFATASIDSTLMALTLLAVAAFSRMYRASDPLRMVSVILFGLLITLLICAHQNLFPLAILLAALSIKRKSFPAAVVLFFVVVFGTLWAATALHHTVDFRVARNMSGGGIIQYYVQRPWLLLEMIVNSCLDLALLRTWWESWVGVLGWLDTRLPQMFYSIVPWILGFTAVLAMNYREIVKNKREVAWLSVIAVGMVGVTFLAMIFSWTPIPSQKIAGVQGRYFIIPSLLVASTFQGWSGAAKIRSEISHFVLSALWCLATCFSASAIWGRYHG